VPTYYAAVCRNLTFDISTKNIDTPVTQTVGSVYTNFGSTFFFVF